MPSVEFYNLLCYRPTAQEKPLLVFLQLIVTVAAEKQRQLLNSVNQRK